MKQYIMLINEVLASKLSPLASEELQFLEVQGLPTVQNGHSYNVLLTPVIDPIPAIEPPVEHSVQEKLQPQANGESDE